MNSYDVPFLKISTNFVISWDPEVITESFTEIVGKETVIGLRLSFWI